MTALGDAGPSSAAPIVFGANPSYGSVELTSLGAAIDVAPPLDERSRPAKPLTGRDPATVTTLPETGVRPVALAVLITKLSVQILPAATTVVGPPLVVDSPWVATEISEIHAVVTTVQAADVPSLAIATVQVEDNGNTVPLTAFKARRAPRKLTAPTARHLDTSFPKRLTAGHVALALLRLPRVTDTAMLKATPAKPIWASQVVPQRGRLSTAETVGPQQVLGHGRATTQEVRRFLTGQMATSRVVAIETQRNEYEPIQTVLS